MRLRFADLGKPNESPPFAPLSLHRKKRDVDDVGSQGTSDLTISPPKKKTVLAEGRQLAQGFSRRSFGLLGEEVATTL